MLTYLPNRHFSYSLSAGHILFSVMTKCTVRKRWRADSSIFMTTAFSFYMLDLQTSHEKKVQGYLFHSVDQNHKGASLKITEPTSPSSSNINFLA